MTYYFKGGDFFPANRKASGSMKRRPLLPYAEPISLPLLAETSE
jgi:hypothetical protein